MKIHYCFAERAVTPGNSLPSSNSREAPPPVDTCETLSSAPHLATAVAVSPPPTIVVAPFCVASITASKADFVPAANLSNSNTPVGPFHNIVLASRIVSLKSSFVFSPESSPSHSSGIPVSSVAYPV